MDKKGAAQKIVKLLTLQNDSGASPNEKTNAFQKIMEICEKYHLRIEGVNIIDVDIEAQNERIKFNQLYSNKPILQSSAIDLEKTNCYVYYKGKKYYNKVPKHLYTNKDYYLK